MRRRVVAVAAVALCLAVRERGAWAQEKTPVPGRAPVPTVTRLVALFAGLENDWLEAVRRRDEAALSALLADDFEMRLASHPAAPVPRAEWIEQALAGPAGPWLVRDVAARDLAGPVVVSFRLEPGPGARGGRPAFVVDTWVQVQGSWKAKARYVGPADGNPLGLPGEFRTPRPPPKKY